MNLFSLFKDIIAPKKCYGCGCVGSFLCKSCLQNVKKYENICYVCKQKTINYDNHFYCKNDKIYYDKIIVLYHYNDKIIKKLIKNFKFYNKKEIINDLILDIDNYFRDLKKEDIILIPTPIFWYKRLKRGYNQSELIIKYISKKYGYKYDFNLIKKVKNTKPQSHLSKFERLENLTNCYKVDKNLLNIYKNKTFVIVDDVVSTGSTINEVSKVLKKYTKNKTFGLCLASD